MATCSSFQEIFENPLPENPTLIESLASSWKQIKAKKQAELSSFTEIFGELHFRENPPESFSSSFPPPPSSFTSSSMDVNLQPEIEKLNDVNNEKNTDPSLNSLLGTPKNQYISSAANNGKKGFSPKKPASLKLCTEGLGFESSDEVENSKNQSGDEWKNHGKEKDSSSGNLIQMNITKNPSSGDLSEISITKNSSSDNLNEFRRLKPQGRNFPPPISCIGRNGKPRVCLRSYRYNGRFVLKEIEIPTVEVLHACREGGRLTLHLVLPEKEIPEEEGEGEELEEEEENYDPDEQEEDEEGEEEKKNEFSKDEVQNLMV
ncbi:The fantastic four family [Macleaya cordata]|uniref:The fantastic four family n=1 Tax=Macleaya cordata TaxID=56857 RepID=A0A200Q6C4_MACCD|nr:The fantastic four family [Macleaya cordata]